MFDFFKGTVTPKDMAIVGAIVFVTVVLFAGFYFILYTGQQEKLTGIEAEIEAIQKDLLVAYNTQKNIEALRTESAKMEKLVDLFEERLPDKQEIPRLLRKFEGMGDELGLRVELSMLQNEKDGRKVTIPYDVVARGSFHQIVNFINLLERDDRYLKISDLEIGEEEAGVSEANFTLSAFRFDMESATTGAE